MVVPAFSSLLSLRGGRLGETELHRNRQPKSRACSALPVGHRVSGASHGTGDVLWCARRTRHVKCVQRPLSSGCIDAGITTSTEHKDGTHTQYTRHPDLPHLGNEWKRTHSGQDRGRADNTSNEATGTWVSGLSPTQRPSNLRPDTRNSLDFVSVVR